MSAADFFDYLLGRESTHDLALQLAYVYDQRERQRRATRVGTRR